MSIEVGNKLKGKITGIKKFGAFVELSEGENSLAHISEVADNRVKSVEEHLSVGNEVNVKTLSIADNGKISLSTEKAKDRPRRQHTSKPSHQKPVQKVEDLEKKLGNSLEGSEDKLASVRYQTELRRGGKGSER